MEFKTEVLSDEFTKYRLDDYKNGDHFAIHHFTGNDVGLPHNHPFKFTTHILKPQNGGYWERIYSIEDTVSHFEKTGNWVAQYTDVFRPVGTSNIVEANTIHQIVGLPSKEVWTIILPQEKIQDWSFFDFREDGIYKRFHYEEQWTKIH